MASYKTLLFMSPFGVAAATYRGYALVSGSSATRSFIAYENEFWGTRVVRTAGEIQTLAVKRGGGDASSDTLTLRLNFADTSLAVTTSGATGSGENSGSQSVAVGDSIDLNGSASVARLWIRSIFSPTDDNTQVSLYGTRGNGSGFAIGAWLASTAGTNYLAFTGGNAPNSALITSETNVRTKMKTAGSFRNVSVNVVRNTSTSSVTFKSRKNGADGNISITIPAGSTGVFSDLVNTDALVVNDEYNFSCSATAFGRVEFSELYCEYANTVIAGDHDLFSGRPGQGLSIPAASTARYFPIAGDFPGTQQILDSLANTTIGMESGAKKFRIVVSGNTCSADQVFTVAKNGAATALTFTVPAGVTGEFIDDINEISLTATDTVSVMQTGGGSGALAVEYFAMVIPGAATTPEPPTPTPSEFTPGYFIERMDDRIWPTIDDVWCLDSALEYPMPTPDAILEASTATGDSSITEYVVINGGANYVSPIAQVLDAGGTGTGATLSLTLLNGVVDAAVPLSVGSGYSHPQVQVLDETGTGAVIQAVVTNYTTLSASTSSFTASDVGSIIRMGGGKAEIITVSSSTSVIANLITPITNTIANDPLNTPVPAASGEWSMTAPTMTVSGLHHLEGLTVAALADGGVVRDLVVTDGSVTLPVEATAIVVGLPFVAQLQTMYLDAGAGPTVQGRRKSNPQVIVRVENSRPMQIGANQPDQAAQPNQAAVTWTQMTEVKFRTPNMPAGQPMPLYSGDYEPTNLFGGYDTRGQVAIQQADPVPLTVLAVVVQTTIGDDPSK